MSVIPLPELISAYLDGEATAEERKLVEQALVEDAALRRLYYELRALQTRLAKLPRYRLPQELSREILRRAERMLASRQHNEAVPKVELAPPRRSNRWWKATAWIGVAAAALVTLAIGPWTQPDLPRIARHDPLATKPAEIDHLKLQAKKDAPRNTIAAQPVPALSAPGSPPTDNPAPIAAPMVAVPLAEIAAQPLREAKFKEFASRKEPLADAGLITVRCDVRAAADFATTFDRSLARQQIHWQETSSPRDVRFQNRSAADDSPGKAHDLKELPAKKEVVTHGDGQKDSQPLELKPGGAPVVPAKPNAGSVAEAGNNGKDRGDVNGFQKAGEALGDTVAASLAATDFAEAEVELVYVEATPQQFAALMNDLRGQQGVFLSTELVPSVTGELVPYVTGEQLEKDASNIARRTTISGPELPKAGGFGGGGRLAQPLDDRAKVADRAKSDTPAKPKADSEKSKATPETIEKHAADRANEDKFSADKQKTANAAEKSDLKREGKLEGQQSFARKYPLQLRERLERATDAAAKADTHGTATEQAVPPAAAGSSAPNGGTAFGLPGEPAAPGPNGAIPKNALLKGAGSPLPKEGANKPAAEQNPSEVAPPATVRALFVFRTVRPAHAAAESPAGPAVPPPATEK